MKLQTERLVFSSRRIHIIATMILITSLFHNWNIIAWVRIFTFMGELEWMHISQLYVPYLLSKMFSAVKVEVT